MRRAIPSLLLLAACGGGWPTIVARGAVPASDGAPSVGKVWDLGDLAEVPFEGPVPKDGIDGTFVVGEYILITGSSFGKQPTVLLGGSPVKALARTSGGGIIAQIPPGIPAGKMSVEVSHPGGKGARDVEVHRYGLITQADAGVVHVVDVSADAATAKGQLAVADPRAVRFSADGASAYVAASAPVGDADAPGMLHIVALGAPGGPKAAFALKTRVRTVVSLAVAQTAPLLAIVGDRTAQLFLLQDQRHPSPYVAFELPQEIAAAGVLAADLSPDGKLLIVLVAEGNLLHVFDVSTPETPTPTAVVELLPGERLPMVRDVRINAAGDAAWVVAGDTAGSIGAGKQPTRLITVAIPGFTVTRTADVNGATAPVQIAVARSTSLASATAIRNTASEVAVFVTGVSSSLLELTGADAGRSAELLKPLAEPGMLVRTDMDGKGGPLFTMPAIVLSSPELSWDAGLLLVSGCKATVEGNALSLRFGVAVAPLAGAARPVFLELGAMDAAALRAPFVLGQVGIQP